MKLKKIIALCLGLSFCLSSASLATASNVITDEYGRKIYSEEEDQEILRTERQQRKEELGLSKAITQDMYAAFFGNDHCDPVNTSIDVGIANKYFRQMGYITEPFIDPTPDDIGRRYYCTDILMFAGHGNYDRVFIRPNQEYRNSDNNTGVHMGDKNISGDPTDKGTYFIGIGKKRMNSRFVMFTACESAAGNNNIAKSSIANGARASIGWPLKVASSHLQEWEESFLMSLSDGQSIKAAKKSADIVFGGSMATDDTGVLHHELYGDLDMVLSRNRSTGTLEIPVFELVKEKLNIDCENNDLDELTQYLNENLEGFDDTFELSLVAPSEPDERTYTIMYRKKYNGFSTPYFVYVSADEKNNIIEYYNNLKDFNSVKMARSIHINANNIPEDLIEKAKLKAIGDGYEGYTVDSQRVAKCIDKNYQPYLSILTTFVDSSGQCYVEDFNYYLDSFNSLKEVSL